MARNYTPEEEAALRDLYPAASQADVLAALPTRTWHEIQMAANRRGISRPRSPHKSKWRGAPVEAIRARYQQEGAQKLAVELGVPAYSISRQAYGMGLRYNPTPKPDPKRVERQAAAAARRLARWEASEAARKKKEAREKAQQAREAVRQTRQAPKPPKPVAPPPAKRSPGTPNLNAQMAKKAAQKAAQEAGKPKDYVSAEQIKKLGPNHPARIAYTMAASRGGMPAAQAAYHQAMEQYKQVA